MKLLRKIVIKQVLTETKKAVMVTKFQEEFTQCKREVEQMKFLLHKAIRESTSKNEQQEIRARYMKEIEKREETARSISFKIEQLDKLEIGTEIPDGTAEGIIEIREGDSWPNLEQTPEIIVKDGVIQEIRESRNNDD
ncbi:YlqD family protein [Halalkalibacter flavus]|uniref:YlqD family protein n=1 Tax=Halalkalibacter flavus TaxID=3090668 RepID=UPI002FC720ED